MFYLFLVYYLAALNLFYIFLYFYSITINLTKYNQIINNLISKLSDCRKDKQSQCRLWNLEEEWIDFWTRNRGIVGMNKG